MTLILIGILLVLAVFNLPKGFHIGMRFWAVRTAKHYELLPTGNQPDSWERPTSQIGGVLNTLGFFGGFTIHRWKDKDVDGSAPIHTAITVWGRSPDLMAESIASAIGAKLKSIEPTWPLFTDDYMYITNRGVFNQSASPAGEDLARTAETLADILAKSPDETAVHISGSYMSSREVTRYSRWVEDKQLARQQVNQTFGSVVKGTIIATGSSSEVPRELAASTCSLIPNFLYSTKAGRLHDRALAPPFFVFAFGLHLLVYLFLSFWFHLPVLLLSLIGVAMLMDRWHIRKSLVMRSLRYGVIYNGGGSVSWRSLIRLFMSGEGDEVVSTAPNWKKTTLPLNAGHIASLSYLPSALSSVGEAATSRTQAAPAKVRQAKGVTIGTDSREQRCCIPDDDRFGGVFISGDPGMGKTVGLLGIWFGDVAHRRDGATYIWIETKGEGAESAIRMAAKAGLAKSDLMFFDVNAGGLQPDFLNHGSSSRSARVLVEAMKHAFEQGEIMGQAENVLESALHLALAIYHEPDLPDFNVMDVAYLLIGGTSEAKYNSLVSAVQKLVKARADVPEFDVDSDDDSDLENIFNSSSDDLVEAWKGWEQFHNLPVRKRQEITTSSRNRIAALRKSTDIWNPDSKRVTFKEMVSSHKVLVLNFGSPLRGEDVEASTKSAAQRIAAMYLYLLWDAVTQFCSGWDAEGKAVYIYSDELSHIADSGGSGLNVVEEIRDKGRSYGVKANFATQRIDQLGEKTQPAVLSFKQKVYLGTETPGVAEIYAEDLTGGEEGSYTAADIRNLSSLTGIARLNIDGQPQQPFNLTFVLPPDLDREEALEGWE